MLLKLCSLDRKMSECDICIGRYLLYRYSLFMASGLEMAEPAPLVLWHRAIHQNPVFKA